MVAVAAKYNIDLTYDHKTGCPGCIRQGGDGSRNNLQVYAATASAFCFACNWTIASAEHKEKMGWDDEENYQEELEIMTREAITPEENKIIKGYTGTASNGWRGIKNETNVVAGVRYQYDEETGEPIKQFVPTTIDGKLVGYKTRSLPKDFSSPIGVVGSTCELVGQFRYKVGGRTVLIVGGEIDYLSSEQLLWDYQVSKNNQDYPRVAVVSPTVGETSSVKQIQAQYAFFDSFEKIIIGFDNDEAGKKATELVAKVLPRGKIFIAQWSKKDPNSLLMAGLDKTFISDYYNAKPYTPAGVVAASTIYQEVVERSKVEKLSFPTMMARLNKMLAGGINYGYIVNVMAGSGCGKSSWINQCVAYWMTELNHKVMVVSLEAESSEFGENLLSYHMGRKIAMIEDQAEKIAFVGSAAAEKAANELFMFPDGQPRLYLLDDRGDFSKLQEKIEECVISHDVKIVVIDVISDVFAGASLEEVDKWMKWEKNLVKKTGIVLLQAAHCRKSASGTKDTGAGSKIDESMLIGSGTQYRSAGINIALQRDKTAEDDTERNTVYVHLLKSRATGMTGSAGQLYYDNETATLYDKEVWLEEHGHSFTG